MTTITEFPTPPSRTSSPDVFEDQADAFFAHFSVFAGEVNTVAGEVNANRSAAETAANTATTKASEVSTNAATVASNTTTVVNKAAEVVTNASNAATSETNAANSAAAAVATPVAAPTHAATSKATPVDADEIPLIDSAASFGLKKLTWANLKAALLPSFRNKIINGNGLIQQRSVTSLSTAAQYGPDRWIGAISGGTGISGNFSRSGFGGSSSGYGIYIGGSTFTNGQPYFAQRIESANVTDLNGKTVTVSGKIYHDAGTSQNFAVRLQKANSADNFGATTVVATSSNIAVSSGVVTSFSVSFTLGSSDATNGLVIELYVASPLTVSNKNFAISDIQFEQGSVATPFEARQIGMEYEMCRRYRRRYATAQNTADLAYQMRATPTQTGAGPYDYDAEL